VFFSSEELIVNMVNG